VKKLSSTIKREAAFSPLNKIVWMKAIRARKLHVTLRDGRRFRLVYKRQRLTSEHREVVWFEPMNEEFAPCGYLRLSIVTDKLWLEESDRADMPDGKYVVMLDEFINSDLQGVEASDHWPELKGRLKATLQRAFAQAKVTRGKGADHVKITTVEGRVFLLKENNG